MSKYDLKKIKFTEKTGVLFAMIAGAFLCVASVIMFVNMTTRTVADINIKLVFEVAQLCGAGVASFAIPYATIKGSHTEMDIITSHLKPKRRALLEAVSGVITIVIMAFTVYILLLYAYQRTVSLELTTTNHLPIYLFRWTYAMGMLFTLVAAAIEMVDNFRIASGRKVIRNREELNALENMESLETEEGGKQI